MREQAGAKKVLWLITARSGSKGVPDKNIRELGGLPLLAWRIKAALALAPKEDVWLSTDSEEYAQIGRAHGATVPGLRPAELASDTATSADVTRHAMDVAIGQSRRFDGIGLLQPTSPFVSATQLHEAVGALFRDPDAEAIVAVRRAKPSSFYVQPQTTYLSDIARNIRGSGVKRRQEERPEVTPSGGFYIAKWDAFLQTHSFYTEWTRASLVPEESSLDIDEPLDWEFAQFLVERNVIDVASLFEVRQEPPSCHAG